MGQDEPKVDVDDVSLRVQENVPIVPECVFGLLTPLRLYFKHFSIFFFADSHTPPYTLEGIALPLLCMRAQGNNERMLQMKLMPGNRWIT